MTGALWVASGGCTFIDSTGIAFVYTTKIGTVQNAQSLPLKEAYIPRSHRLYTLPLRQMQIPGQERHLRSAVPATPCPRRLA